MSYSSLFLSKDDEETDPSSVTKTHCYRVLLVDDEPNVLSSLKRIFRQENYEILTANNADEALHMLKTKSVHLVISDFKMPGMNGAELLQRIKERYPDTIRIMLTGHADSNAVMGAINDGAVYKFILKPWHDDDLRVTVSLALEQYDLRCRNQELRETTKKQKKQISSLSKLAVNNRSQLAVMLNKHGLLNDRQVQELHKLQQARKQPMMRLLLEKLL